ncbi:response regulator [Sphingomonas sp. ASV193]|uniref:response regulator n=1 Tax=Sphingomonas sp. ASV193 TaxID=3144405 RepID=UPI0032E92CF6
MLFGRRKRIVKRILVVEDEPLTAFDNESMLDAAGYEVVATLDTYAAAVEALDSEKVDLILSDVRLAGKRGGVELAEEARRRSIPVLFVTGSPPPQARELAIGSLLKPYTDRTLRAALKAVEAKLGGEKARPPKGMELYETAVDPA